MAACKLVWCPKTPEETERFFTKDFGPLLQKHWDIETGRTGEPHGLDVPSFMAAWEQKGIVLIMAYEGEQAVGFMVAYQYRPLFFLRTVMNIERWYAETPEVERVMFEYLWTVLPVMNIDHVHAVEHEGQHVPDSIARNNADTYSMTRLKV